MSKLPREYIVVCQSAWMNEHGYGINYGWDGERFPTRAEAIAHGFEIRQSDDFNIAVVAGNLLISFDWMEEPVGEDDAGMQTIAAALRLRFEVPAAPEVAHASDA